MAVSSSGVSQRLALAICPAEKGCWKIALFATVVPMCLFTFSHGEHNFVFCSSRSFCSASGMVGTSPDHKTNPSVFKTRLNPFLPLRPAMACWSIHVPGLQTKMWKLLGCKINSTMHSPREARGRNYFSALCARCITQRKHFSCYRFHTDWCSHDS